MRTVKEPPITAIGKPVTKSPVVTLRDSHKEVPPEFHAEFIVGQIKKQGEFQGFPIPKNIYCSGEYERGDSRAFDIQSDTSTKAPLSIANETTFVPVAR
ncbi:hypothetical protein HYFRA_00013065 [Hymenoscyphus fraxineus]|uniref:Uncharacterized protein n=1 Tax=Hymenoscyphus fraxineus TaxID=746836 RepID=A0A9N9L7U4_9HELO|nr:hypothetical protein HYFRA_00013065 [Hymenoscyphus fraxineus]